MILNNPEQFKANFKQEIVDVPEFGEGAQVIVREMSAGRNIAYALAREKEPEYWLEHLIIACLVTDEDKQLVSHDDVHAFSENMPIEVANRLFEAVKKVHPDLFADKTAKKKNS